MNTSRHPSEDALLALASGEADGPLQLLLETHLQSCDACAAQVRATSLAGGAFLASLDPEPLPPGSFAGIWSRIAAEAPLPSNQVPLPHLPPAIAAQVALAKPWRWSRLLARGMDNLKLMLDPRTGSALYLLHLTPGGRFPRHRHRGGEEALVLAGGCLDAALRLEPGDWASYPAGSTHSPMGDPEEGCWILLRLEGDEVAFQGWRGVLQSAWERLAG